MENSVAKCKEITVSAPVYWASYLINGDPSSFDYWNTPNDKAGDRDMAMADKLVAWCRDEEFDGAVSVRGLWRR